jgi:hypothetical protein
VENKADQILNRLKDEQEEDAAEVGDLDLKASEVSYTVRKLLTLIDRGELVVFDKREATAIQQMARLWLGFASVGIAADALRKIVMWVGGCVIAYFAIKNYAGDWVRGLIK